MSKMIDLNLSTLKDGAIQEQFELEMNQVLKNIHDLNTDSKKKRQVTITLDFTADESRNVVTMNHTIKSKLAPQMSVGLTLVTGKGFETGQIEACELKSGIPHQAYLDVETSQVLDDVGNPTEADNIIDLQAK